MFDAFGIPTPTEDGLVQVFVASGAPSGSTFNHVQIWRKPRGCNFVYITAIGGGGAGGGGNAVAGTSGGGGGGSGASMSVLYLAAHVPDALYVLAGTGGVGSVVGGGNGIASKVFVYPYGALVDQNNLAYAGGGTGGGTGAGGAAGSSTITATLHNTALSFYSSAGSAGAAPDTNTTFGTASPRLGGAGAAVTTGGGVGGTASTLLTPGMFPAADVTSPDGKSGFYYPQAGIWTGGLGGLYTGASVGAVGGNGIAPGTGGGGGASGTSSGGRSGDGGPGLVVIWCW